MHHGYPNILGTHFFQAMANMISKASSMITMSFNFLLSSPHREDPARVTIVLYSPLQTYMKSIIQIYCGEPFVMSMITHIPTLRYKYIDKL